MTIISVVSFPGVIVDGDIVKTDVGCVDMLAVSPTMDEMDKGDGD